MNKSKLIQNLIKELQSDTTYYLGEPQGSSAFDKDEYSEIDPWDDLYQYFSKLNNIDTIICVDFNWIGNIYKDLGKFKNIKTLYFNSSDLSKTEEFINEGLKYFPKLETLCFAGTNLKNFPKEILDRAVYEYDGEKIREASLAKLKSLGLGGNKFYKQNLHFKLNKECKDLYSDINNLLREKLEKVYSEIKGKTYSEIKEINISYIEKKRLERKKLDYNYYFIEYSWGLYNKDSNILILKDDFLNNNEGINSISVYVLNENKQDKYEIFNTFYNLFEELDKRVDCFEKKKIKSKQVLDVFFFLEEEYDGLEVIDFEELKQAQKVGNKQYFSDSGTTYFVGELLEYIGGEKIIEDIEEERQAEQKIRAKEFEKESYISSVKIKNFKIFEEINIEHLSKINIVIGKNGTGKTSLLQSIAIGLIPQNSEEIGFVHNFYKYEHYINQRLKEKTDNLKYAEITLAWSDNFERSQRIFSNELLQKNELPQTYLALAYGENIFSDKKYSVSNHLKSLETGSDKSHSVISLFHNYYTELPNPLEILEKLHPDNISTIKQENKRKELIVIGELILDVLNKFLQTKPADFFVIKYIDSEKTYKFVDNNDNKLDLYQISEGYRTNIVLLTDILVKILSARNKLFLKPYKSDDYSNILLNVKGTIIIDEFDKHLHPAWQKTFIETLKTEFPEIQFILTTHNIIALQSAEGEKVFKLSFSDTGKIELQEQEIKAGYSIETIYNIFFDGNNELYGNLTEKRFKRFYELFDKIINQNITKEEKDEFKTVTNELFNSSEEVSTAINRELIQYKKQTGKTLI